MPIKELQINDVRNVNRASMECSPYSNLILGPNGSGKTSLLESVSILSQGKSFRNSTKKSVISDNKSSLTITALLHAEEHLSPTIRVGISKYGNGKTIAKIGSRKVQRVSEIATLLPVCVVEPNSTEIIEGGPSLRRQVLDWGVFHVEHSFIAEWQKFNNALKQRNALLRNYKSGTGLIEHWNSVISSPASAVSNYRKKYFFDLESDLSHALSYFFPEASVIISLIDGWDLSASYEYCLNNNLEKDLRYGYTTEGPQKADLHIALDNVLAKDFLSRGQKKLVVYAIRLAQIAQFQRISGQKVSLLLDDLPSELDRENCQKVCNEIKRLGCQVFITAIDTSEQSKMIIEALNPKLFHVEHGTVNA